MLLTHWVRNVHKTQCFFFCEYLYTLITFYFITRAEIDALQLGSWVGLLGNYYDKSLVYLH